MPVMIQASNRQSKPIFILVQKSPAQPSPKGILLLSPNEDGEREGCAAGERESWAGEEGLEFEPGSGGGLEESFHKEGHPVPQVFILVYAGLTTMMMMLNF